MLRLHDLTGGTQMDYDDDEDDEGMAWHDLDEPDYIEDDEDDEGDEDDEE